MERILKVVEKMKKNGINPISLEIISPNIMELLVNRNKYYIEITTNIEIKQEGINKLTEVSIRNSLSPIMSSYKKYKISLDLSFSKKYLKLFNDLIISLNSKDIFIGYYGHLGDGIFHTNICFTKYSKRVDFIMEKLYNFIYEVSGAISGEHGYGNNKKKYVMKAVKDQLPYIRKIKMMFDPNSILNRGLEL